ncbi:hypothetical protein [Calidifontibacter terrae]
MNGNDKLVLGSAVLAATLAAGIGVAAAVTHDGGATGAINRPLSPASHPIAAVAPQQKAAGVNPGAASPYKVNAAGLTYGSDADAAAAGVEPDLVLVVATNGKTGYVLNSDLNGPQPTSPEQAASPQFQSPPPRTITVYESDGKTVVGEFTVGQSR